MPRQRRTQRNRNDWERIGKDIGRQVGRHVESRKQRWTEWSLFGPLAPLFGAVLGIVGLAIGTAILGWINSFLHFLFLGATALFLGTNLHWFFLFMIGTNYLRLPGDLTGTNKLKPVVASVGITVAVWAIAGILGTYGTSSENMSLVSASSNVSAFLVPLFVTLLVVGYIVMAAAGALRHATRGWARKRV